MSFAKRQKKYYIVKLFIELQQKVAISVERFFTDVDYFESDAINNR